MFFVASSCCLCPIHWSQVLSWEWRCSWSSTDRRRSNYIWVFSNFIAYTGGTYIGGLRVTVIQVMTSCCQATNHHLNQYWPHSTMLYDITMGHWVNHIDGLVQDCSIRSALAMEILQYRSKPSICNCVTGNDVIHRWVWCACYFL